VNKEATEILPSGPWAVPRSWGPQALRLHRWLLRRPRLLPRGARLLLAVSGGQDSMALTVLLRDLQPLHGWELALWHGDHGWHAASATVAQELLAWARVQGLTAWTDRAAPGEAEGEAAGRQWRYGCLTRRARHWQCGHVLSGHTATDRAETVLLNLARGCHRRGLASLGPSRPLTDSDDQRPAATLVRPLLIFDRGDTDRICRQRKLPLWVDPSNDDLRLKRNRLRAKLLPVLEDCHPGASRRISEQAERLAEELATDTEIVDLALAGLEGRLGTLVTLDRPALAQLSPASVKRVLARWLEIHSGVSPLASSLDTVEYRLRQKQTSGCLDLPRGWSLSWTSAVVFLSASPHGQSDAEPGRVEST
jgi:tRNA(Ile)-lysidine synthase